MGFLAYPLADVGRKRETEDGKEKNRDIPLTGAAIRDHRGQARTRVPGLCRLMGAGSQEVDTALRSVAMITWHED